MPLLRQANRDAIRAAAFEAMGVEAYVVDDRLMVVDTTAWGRRCLEQNATRVAKLVAGAHHGGAPGVTVAALPSFARLSLVVVAADLETAVDHAADRWHLSHRQRRILRRLALGEASKQIASHLRCAQRTVESHVTRMLRKSGTRDRADLLAALWCPWQAAESGVGISAMARGDSTRYRAAP